MNQDQLDRRLNEIPTAWTALAQAHEGSDTSAKAARQELLERYQRPIYRYLLAATRDPDAADELAQEFALKFLKGDFRHADPGRGRFRDYLKTSLVHQIQRWKGRQRDRPLTADVPEPLAEPAAAFEDSTFGEIWYQELMNQTWDALKRREDQTGQPLYTLLKFRTDQPDLNSQQIAERISERLGRAVTADWVRKWISKARRAFAELLVDEVRASLKDPTDAALEDELEELGLLEPCRAVLREARRGEDQK